jgi:hypothetical protein
VKLSFELRQLNPKNWLTGVETLADLLSTAEAETYGLSKAELMRKIF